MMAVVYISFGELSTLSNSQHGWILPTPYGRNTQYSGLSIRMIFDLTKMHDVTFR